MNHDASRPCWQELIKQSKIPRSEAWILASHVSKHSYTFLRSHDDLPVEPPMASAFFALSSQRLRGVPIAYLTNEREFYGRSFFVDPRVLIPRHETELVVEIALGLLQSKQLSPSNTLSLLDLGTGSGVIPITLALETKNQLRCIGADLSAEALSVAKRNQRSLQGISPLNCQWVQSNWFENLSSLTSSTCFDLITSNPPYIPINDPHLNQGDLRFEPSQALSDNADGLSAYRIIISQASRHLKQNGYLLFEHGYNQAEAINQMFKRYPHWKNIQTERDLSGLARCTYAQYVS